MATPTRRRTPRPPDRREQIAATAAELFCARGYHNVGIGDIAEAVGVTGPAIYRHFSTKQDVLAAAMLDLADELAGPVARNAAADGPAGERLDAALAALVDFSLRRRRAARLYQWEGRHLAAPDRTEVGRRMGTVVRDLRRMLLATRPRLGRTDATVLVWSVLSVIASPSTHRAALARARAQAVLHDCCRAVLAVAELPPPPAAPSGGPALDALPRRERLLVEAVRLFNRHGYHAVSMEDIGAAAGINSSSVYRHFPSKAGVLAAAYYRSVARLEVLAEDVLTTGDPATALDRLVTGYVRHTFAQSEQAAVYVSENENLDPDDRHALRQAQRRHVDLWVELASRARPDDPAPELRFRVHAALNIVTDLARTRRSCVGPEHAERVVRQLIVPEN
ncbi:TetR/AcrR family transcriptional regulator [Amycolatopsis suaedae]|uniref:TetR/AcrR family transcriptional regulator n=1 Tax=Amycolatopsis suaedae TaxID=2510978 RepID=A0A4Q7J850_9PSEU|nr:TetR/AcrR family transcriptional regulator [Amycolatopsis suaedae]RZQ63860.1 TetR/AcrR family transcriptional regulator [Amycolatopsis suaedae]